MNYLVKIGVVALLAVFCWACGPNRHFAVNDAPAPAPEKPVESEAQKLDTVQQQGFNFVYVFRRKDGGRLDAEDRRFLRANAPAETNQWVVPEDGTSAIAGSNYQFPPASLETLRQRFDVEDRSKPKAAPNREAAPNTNQ